MNSFSIKIVFFTALEKLLIGQLSIIKDEVKDLLSKASPTIKISDMCIFKLPIKFSSSFVISIHALRFKCIVTLLF
jgi:hypothetical protein